MRKVPVLLLCLLVLGVGSAIADPLNITNISGVWVNPTGGMNLTGIGTSTVTWGDGVAPESGYVFAPGSDIIGVPLSTAFVLGEFTHNNAPIPAGTAITAIDLSFGFDTNGLPATVSATFNFLHDETPNSPGPPASDDIVTITTPPVNAMITVAGTQVYFFNLLGFSTDGGSTFSSMYSSPEGGNNSTFLYGIITERPQGVPEPGTLLLLCVGIGGLALALRRKTKV
jgi:hypothetical protein